MELKVSEPHAQEPGDGQLPALRVFPLLRAAAELSLKARGQELPPAWTPPSERALSALPAYRFATSAQPDVRILLDCRCDAAGQPKKRRSRWARTPRGKK